MIPAGNYSVLIAVPGIALNITTHKLRAAIVIRYAALVTCRGEKEEMGGISYPSDHAGQAGYQFVNGFKLLWEAKTGGTSRTASAQYAG